MKVHEINLYQYKLPLNNPINMKNHLHNYREGFIVELINSDGIKGYGEAAPFPGLHKESLAEILKQFQKIKPQLSKIIQDDFKIFSLEFPDCSPTLNFAIEWAFIDLISKKKEILPAAQLNAKFNTHVFTNPLLIGDFDSIIDQTKEIKKHKPHAVKIKVGSRPLEDDIYLVKQIDEIFENKISLRLDANRNWSLNQAVTFGHAVLSTNLEYIEEPIDDPFSLHKFYKQTGIRYAIDESLLHESFLKTHNMAGVAAFIIKPSEFGTLKNIKTLVDIAAKKNIYCVFSNTFESGIGLWSNTNLAAAFSNENVSHGLETYNWLESDLISPAFCSNNYNIKLEKNSNLFSIDISSLSLVG